MMLPFKRWLSPPVFPDADGKTRRATVLNAALLTTIALALIVMVGDLLGRRTPPIVIGGDAAAVILCLILRRWMYAGHVTSASIGLIGIDLIGTTMFVALLGTIRTPTTAFYLLIVVGGGLLFDVAGILVTTAVSSLAILALIMVQNAGLLPAPDYAVTATQWITYTALFGLSGGLTYIALQATRQALARADADLAERRQIEEALQQSEALYHTLVETLPLNIFRKDAAGRFTFANSLYCRTQGWPLAEILGKTDFDLHPRDLATKYRADDERLIATGEVLDTIEEHQPIDGPRTYVQVIKAPLHAADGRISGIQGAFWDVTLRKQMEDAVRESEERIHLMFEKHDAVMLLVEPTSGQIIDANLAATRYYGYSLAALTSMRMDDILALPPAPIAEERSQALRAGRGYFVFPHRLASGEIRTVEIHSSPVIFRGQTLLFSIIHDITARRQAEDKLLQRTRELNVLQATVLDVSSPHPLPELLELIVERAANLLASASGGLYLCHEERQEVECVVSYNTLHDYTGTILKYGEGAAGMVARTGQSLIIADYRSWSGRARVYDTDQPFASVLSTPLIWHGQVTGVIHVLRDDESRPFTNDELELLGLFANHAALAVEQARLHTSLEQELTERKLAEEALRDLNAQLEQRVVKRTRELTAANARLTELDRLKDEFISRISHELRTPLANIKLYLKLLGRGKPEKYEHYLETLHAETNKLQGHIDDLLEVSHVRRTILEPHPMTVTINRLVRDMIADQLPQAQVHSLSLAFTAEAEQSDVVTDYALIWEVLSRVLSNALAYTPHGGAITLRTEQRSADNQQWLTIEVRDTGPGITEQDRPHIFEPFYRGRAASDYKTPGTGVGLSIAQRIIQQLGGRITIDSQPDDGSTFTIWLRAE